MSLSTAWHPPTIRMREVMSRSRRHTHSCCKKMTAWCKTTCMFSCVCAEECALEDEVFEDGAETRMECNKCVCACGNWVCTALTCTGEDLYLLIIPFCQGLCLFFYLLRSFVCQESTRWRRMVRKEQKMKKWRKRSGAGEWLNSTHWTDFEL